jgi:ABC-type methionine transport system permease subunit
MLLSFYSAKQIGARPFSARGLAILLQKTSQLAILAPEAVGVQPTSQMLDANFIVVLFPNSFCQLVISTIWTLIKAIKHSIKLKPITHVDYKWQDEYNKPN